MDFAVGWKGA